MYLLDHGCIITQNLYALVLAVCLFLGLLAHSILLYMLEAQEERPIGNFASFAFTQLIVYDGR